MLEINQTLSSASEERKPRANTKNKDRLRRYVVAKDVYVGTFSKSKHCPRIEQITLVVALLA
jgi:hypothetical protein